MRKCASHGRIGPCISTVPSIAVLRALREASVKDVKHSLSLGNIVFSADGVLDNSSQSVVNAESDLDGVQFHSCQ